MEKLFQSIRENKTLIAGPCVIESEEILFEIAGKMQETAAKLGFVYVFKASFDKANRTSAGAYRGPGLEKGLEILAKIKEKFGVPILTDIHESWQAAPVSQVADILQIPAFLCRQTDLLLAAAATKSIVNVKKGQFLTGKDMKYAAQKVLEGGNNRLMLTERGNTFGNNDLVVDFRNIADMMALGWPVVMDVTHAVQKPGGGDGKSSGNREYAPFFAKAAAACGVRAFFFETHPDPARALSDGPNMVPLNEMEALLREVDRHIV